MKPWLNHTNFSQVRQLQESMAHACQPLLIESEVTGVWTRGETANYPMSVQMSCCSIKNRQASSFPDPVISAASSGVPHTTPLSAVTQASWRKVQPVYGPHSPPNTFSKAAGLKDP